MTAASCNTGVEGRLFCKLLCDRLHRSQGQPCEVDEM